MNGFIWIVEINYRAIRAFTSRELAEKYKQCMLEEVDKDGFPLYYEIDLYITKLPIDSK